MKILNMSSFEKLNINEISITDLNDIKHFNYHPKNKTELLEIINQKIKKYGHECDLNDIDVSEITDMSYLFKNSIFNGNISEWDVSNVKDMSYMFKNSDFNGDISKWNVSNVEDMHSMFEWSMFDNDLNSWDVSNVFDMRRMFLSSNFNKSLNNWKINISKTHILDMFVNCDVPSSGFEPKYIS